MSKNTLAIFFVSFLYTMSTSTISGAEDGMAGNIELGGAVVDLNSKSFKYGEYNGVNDNGVYLVANADLTYNKDVFFIDFRASDIGLDSRRLNLETGRYGKFKLFLGYDKTPMLISNNSATPLDGAGSANLTLPSDFVKGSQTANMINLIDNKKDVELSTQREEKSVGFSMNMDKADFKIFFNRDEKNGIQSIGGTLGNNGGNTRSIGLPGPVGYTTDELRTSIAYTGETAQLQFDYFISDFSNDNKYITWDNPFNAADYPAIARTSRPPDNRHQRFSLSGGVNLPLAATRISATAEYGIMEQDDTLLPYSNNINTTITSQLPRETADAEIDITNLGFNISSRPLSRIDLSARYKYYKTDNKTPRTLFLYVMNDMGGASQATETSGNALYSLPYDYTQNQLKFDAAYCLYRGTTLKLGYDHDIIDRDNRETEETIENTYRARLNSSISSHISAGAHFTYGVRRMDGAYDEADLYDNYHTQAYIDTVAATNIRFDNLPDMRKFDIADRDRTRYGANITLLPLSNITVGLYYNYTQDDYEASSMGLLQNANNSRTIDATFTPADFVSTYLYFTNEEVTASQGSRYYRGGVNKPADSIDSNRDWRADHNENIDTGGIGMNLNFMENVLTLGVDYSYTKSTGAIKFVYGSCFTPPYCSGITTTPADMPDLKTRLQTFKASVKYRLTMNTTLGLGYKYETYRSDNWSTDSVDPASTALSNVLTLSGPVSDYEAHEAMLTAAYNW